MDKMSLASILSVSWLEALAFTFITLLIIGRKEVVKLNNFDTVLRVIISSILLTAIGVLARSYSTYFIGNQVVQLLLGILVIMLLFKVEWYNAAIGFTFNLIICTIIELICVLLTSYVTGVDYKLMYVNDVIRFLFSVPPRICNIGLILLLYRLPSLIELKIYKFTVNVCKKVTEIYAISIIGFLQVMFVVKHSIFDNVGYCSPKDFDFMLTIIILTVTLATIIILRSLKLARIIKLERDEKINALMLIESLLKDYKSGKIEIEEVMDVVKSAIDAGGCNNEESSMDRSDDINQHCS